MGALQVFGIHHGLMEKKPKDIAPSIFAISRQKKSRCGRACIMIFWIRKLATSEISTTNHLVEFVDLWYLINEMHLVEGTKDDITWKFTNSEEYSTASA
jgi:hypothetical protein